MSITGVRECRTGKIFTRWKFLRGRWRRQPKKMRLNGQVCRSMNSTKAQVSALFSAGKTGPNDPATENQKDYLRSFGITAKEGLTKEEASELIDRAKDDPAALETRNRLQLAKYEEQRTREAEFPSYHLKQMIASAVKDLEEAKKEKREARALLTNKKNKVAAAQQKRANATDEFEQLSLDNEIKDLEDEASEAEEAFDRISVEEAKEIGRASCRERV